MTLILEFEHRLIFDKPGILRYAMRRARTQLRAAQDRAERHLLLSQWFKRGWAEARAQLAGFQQLRSAAPAWRKEQPQARHDARRVARGYGNAIEPMRDRMDVVADAAPEAALPIAPARQLH